MNSIRIDDELSDFDLDALLYKRIPCPGCQGGGCPTCMGMGYWGEHLDTVTWEQLSIIIYKK